MAYKVKEFREEMKISQEELSKRAGVSRTIISGLEMGKKEVITNVTMERIAKALEEKVTVVFFQD